jgi:hypothetical protein
MGELPELAIELLARSIKLIDAFLRFADPGARTQ